MYRRHVWDHLGLVAGMFDERGMGAVLAHAPPPTLARRDLTVGEAGTAMGRKGLGVIKHVLSLGPRVFPPQPPSRRIAPRVAPDPLTDEALGRAVATR